MISNTLYCFNVVCCQGQYDKIHNVIVTHNHFDHYRFIPDVLNPDTADLSGLTNVYSSCTYVDHAKSLFSIHLVCIELLDCWRLIKYA